MKRLIYVSVFVACLLLVSVPSFPQAQPNTNVYDMPFDVTWNVPCANGGLGEDVYFFGTVHAVETTVVNQDKLHMIWSYNPVGLTGIGMTTGIRYHGVGVTRQDFQANGVVFPYNLTFVNRTNLVSEGPEANSMLFGRTTHVTINADGETTVSFDTSVVSCKPDKSSNQ
jgi:hypothetical protein